jgi:ABC-type transporter MlaC component
MAIFAFIFSLDSLTANSAEFTESLFTDLKELRAQYLTSGSKKEEKVIKQEVQELVRGLLDPRYISELIISELPAKFDKKQQDRIEVILNKLLTDRLMQANLPAKSELKKMKGKIPFEVKGEVKEQNKIIKGTAFIAKAQTKRRRVIYEIDLCYYKTDNGYKLFDVRIDGASTILDFRNQFSSIIKKKGVNHLLDLLEKKVSTLNTGS